ncbi:hypothetical protein Bca4012_015504 [Brassica carinata]
MLPAREKQPTGSARLDQREKKKQETAKGNLLAHFRFWHYGVNVKHPAYFTDSPFTGMDFCDKGRIETNKS